MFAKSGMDIWTLSFRITSLFCEKIFTQCVMIRTWFEIFQENFRNHSKFN